MLFVFATVWGQSPATANSKYASIVVDQNTGRVLYSRHADAARHPASLTKIMTLYMVFEQLRKGTIQLDTPLKVSAYAAAKPPSKIGFKPGQTVRVEHAIQILVTKSANDVAAAVAENLAGSEAAFARHMTAKARDLGMSNTTFRNASGLPDDEQVTTARDMATLAKRIRYDFPEYYEYFSTKYFSYRGKRYRNHNGLLFSYKGTDGIKTGYIRDSGFNLTASVHRGNKHLVAVVMGGRTSRSRNDHMASLLDRSWQNASARKLLTPSRRAPMPSRNPIDRDPAPAPAPVPMVSNQRPVQTASLAGTAGIILDSADPRKLLRGAQPEEKPHLHPRQARATPEPQHSGDYTPQRSGDYHVQVGAYASRSEAQEQLHVVKSRADGLLNGHTPFTMPVPQSNRYLYRARFAGFTEGAARNACSQLMAQKIPCIVMRAE